MTEAVDYVAWLTALPTRLLDPTNIGRSESLASHLTALREAMKGCGRENEFHDLRLPSDTRCSGRWRCAECRGKRDQAIAALTHTETPNGN